MALRRIFRNWFGGFGSGFGGVPLPIMYHFDLGPQNRQNPLRGPDYVDDNLCYTIRNKVCLVRNEVIVIRKKL